MQAVRKPPWKTKGEEADLDRDSLTAPCRSDSAWGLRRALQSKDGSLAGSGPGEKGPGPRAPTMLSPWLEVPLAGGPLGWGIQGIL